MLTIIITLLLLCVFSVGTVLTVRRYRNSAVRNQVDDDFIPLCTTSVKLGIIDIKHFEKCFRNELDDVNYLKGLFQSLPEIEPTQRSTVGLQEKNINKNRGNYYVIPYDNTRVVLKEMDGVGQDDYINASYINGYERLKAYIACEGPKFNTVTDFWRMIWQENVETVVMASGFMENQERMCAEYWQPRVDTLFECGKMTIKLIDEAIREHYDTRNFEVCYKNEKRHIFHLHLKWDTHTHQCFYPNHIVPVVKLLRQVYKESTNPIVIHSGHRTERAGTLILCDLALNMAEVEGKVDFFNLTKNLRKQRPRMIHKVENYILAHLIVMECLIEKENPFKKSFSVEIERKTINQQMKYLKKLQWIDGIVESWTPDRYNQYQDINPVLVDGYGKVEKYLIVNKPTQDNAEEFWHMVANESVSCILSPIHFLDKEQTLIRFPRNINSDKTIHVDCLSTVKTSYAILTEVLLLITEKSSKEIRCMRTIYLFELNCREQDKSVPESEDHFLNFVEDVVGITNSQEKILIACGDATTACGLFVVLSYIIEKYRNELEIDINGAIRIARRGDLNFVNTFNHLKYVYSCISKYLQSRGTYEDVHSK